MARDTQERACNPLVRPMPERFRATPPTLRVPPTRFIEELRDAAAATRLPLRTYTGQSGWEGE